MAELLFIEVLGQVEFLHAKKYVFSGNGDRFLESGTSHVSGEGSDPSEPSMEPT